MAACAPPAGSELAAGSGNVTLFLSGGGRSLAEGTLAEVSYELDFSGPGGETLRRSAGPGTGSVSLTLTLGRWTVRAAAARDGRPFGSGETAFTVGTGTNQASLTMNLFPVWYVAGAGAGAAGNDANPGSQAAPLATVAEALSRIKAAYAGGADWSNNGLGPGRPAPARIVINGAVTETGGTNAMVEIRDDSASFYGVYPPVILEGGAAGGTLDAESANRVLLIAWADVTLTGDLTLTGGSPAGGGGGAVMVGGSGENGRFTMEGGTITGNETTISSTSGGGVYVAGGEFLMKGGTISDNHVTGTFGNGGGVAVQGVAPDTPVFTMEGGTVTDNTAPVFGGGVTVEGDGAFIMKGGTISGNHTTATGGLGGGVYVNNGAGDFTMTGGTIGGRETDDKNTADTSGGGVYFEGGRLTLGGNAVIHGNEADDAAFGQGGGVFVAAGDFLLTGNAVISGNKAAGSGGGGGVYFRGGTFTMDGGTIDDNTATGGINSSGGGVHVNSGSFDMTGGIISGNKAAFGGGVRMDGAGIFKMSGDAKVIDNTASITPAQGGGVYFNGSGVGSFTMEDQAEISGNIAAIGGGVYVAADTFTMTGGTIGSNTATSTGIGTGGGGVYVMGSGTFTMTGGTIGGNTAVQGGGVYVMSVTFTKDVPAGTGVIYGNNALPGQANTAVSDGQAVFVASGSLERNTTAEAGVALDGSTGTTGVAPWL